jgi:hypothetical protein
MSRSPTLCMLATRSLLWTHIVNNYQCDIVTRPAAILRTSQASGLVKNHEKKPKMVAAPKMTLIKAPDGVRRFSQTCW